MILARSGSAWTTATSLLNAHVAAFKVHAMQSLDGGLSVLSEGKLDEAKATGVA